MTLAVVRSAGGVVLGESGTIALVRVRGNDGSYLFPKGVVEDGETDEVTARREIEEETGLRELELLDDLGSYKRYALKQDGTYDFNVLKEIQMFLFATAKGARLSPTMEIEDAKWVPFREVVTVIGNEKDRAWFASVFERVREAIERD